MERSRRREKERPMTIPYIEADCTFTHDGHSFTSGGAIVLDDFAIGYLDDTGAGYVLKDWHGTKTLGNAWVVASWSTPRSAYSHRMLQVEALIDGHKYTGRCAGVGMVWRGKRKK
jgi:hypothetical protein